MLRRNAALVSALLAHVLLLGGAATPSVDMGMKLQQIVGSASAVRYRNTKTD